MSKTKKENAEEDYPKVPISVLSYIGSLEQQIAELKEQVRWRDVEKPEDINNFDILYLVEKGTGKGIISKKFEVLFPSAGSPEIIYNQKNNYYLMWDHYILGESHISELWGIRLPAKGG